MPESCPLPGVLCRQRCCLCPGSLPSRPDCPSCPRRSGLRAPARPSAGLFPVRIATRNRTRAGGVCEGVSTCVQAVAVTCVRL